MAQEVRKVVMGKTFVCIPNEELEGLCDLFVEVEGKREELGSGLEASDLEDNITCYITAQDDIVTKNEKKKEKVKETIKELKSKGWS